VSHGRRLHPFIRKPRRRRHGTLLGLQLLHHIGDGPVELLVDTSEFFCGVVVDHDFQAYALAFDDPSLGGNVVLEQLILGAPLFFTPPVRGAWRRVAGLTQKPVVSPN
jgi:hypothetical protein